MHRLTDALGQKAKDLLVVALPTDDHVDMLQAVSMGAGKDGLSAPAELALESVLDFHGVGQVSEGSSVERHCLSLLDCWYYLPKLADIREMIRRPYMVLCRFRYLFDGNAFKLVEIAVEQIIKLMGVFKSAREVMIKFDEYLF